MRPNHLVATIVAAAVLTSTSVGAQQASDTTARRQQRALDSLATALRTLQARMDSLEHARASASTAAAPVRTSGAYMNVSFVGLTDFGWSSTPDVESLQKGDHDPKVRGFSLRNAELSLDGAVDPYFKGVTNIVYKLDNNGETSVELEEMFVLTTALPANLQLKVGQFFAEFGRQNPQHPHSWGFADQPLVLNRMFGPDGLRSQGVRLSWLLPTDFYTEASLAVLNSSGGTASSFRSEESGLIHGGAALDRQVKDLGDMLYVPRVATSFELNDTQTLVLGASGAFGPNNSGVNTSTKIYGGDLYWKWKSTHADQGFPFVSVQSEYIFRHYDAAKRAAVEDLEAPRPPGTAVPQLAAQTLKDDGAYAQILWGIQPRIVAGFRGEFAHADKSTFVSADRADRTRWSPNLTWYPTEFSKFRVQYNFDHRTGIGEDHSLWFQFEFLLGAHAAHKF